MADIYRNPVVVNKRDIPPALGLRQVVVGSLLTTTLAVVAAALPFNNAGAFPALSHDPASRHALLADTTQDTPKTLTADSRLPFLAQPQSLQERVRPVADTSRGTPKTLTADTPRPASNPTVLQGDIRRFLSDTSADSPIPLLAAVVPSPVVPIPHQAPARFWWQPADTSKGFAKPLFADAQAPVFNIPQYLVERTRYSQDTTADSPTPLLLAPIPAPIVNPLQFAPDRLRPVADTSSGTPKALTADKQLPVFNPPPPLLDRVRPVVNTSAGTATALLPVVVVPPPFIAPAQPGVQRLSILSETSFGSPSVLLYTVGTITIAWHATQPPTGHGAPMSQRTPALSVGRRPSAFSRTR